MSDISVVARLSRLQDELKNTRSVIAKLSLDLELLKVVEMYLNKEVVALGKKQNINVNSTDSSAFEVV